MKFRGFVLMAIGAAVMGYAYLGYDTTVGDLYDVRRTHNLGLLQNQMMIWQGGIGLLLAGAMFAAIGILLERLDKSLAPETSSSDPANSANAEAAAASGEDDAVFDRPGGLEIARSRIAGNPDGDDGAKV